MASSVLLLSLDFLALVSSSVGLGESSEGQVLKMSASNGVSSSDDSGSGVEALDGDVLSVERVLQVSVDGVDLTLTLVGSGGFVLSLVDNLLLESNIESGSITSFLGGGLDGDTVRLGKTRDGSHISVGKIVRVLGELVSVLLDQEGVVVLSELPDELRHLCIYVLFLKGKKRVGGVFSMYMYLCL